MADQPARAIPVTVLSGFLGSGKTTLLKNILQHKGALRCAVIVNDMAELNIDAALVQQGDVLQREEKLVQMQNGCICCTLREDLLQELRILAQQRRFDHVIIESTGISEPQQVAETFFFQWDDQPILNTQARLDCCVTVVDAAQCMKNIRSLQALSERFEEKIAPEDERNVADLMIDQLEFADVILLNKIDLISTSQRESLSLLIKKLNPRAKIIPTKFGRVDLKYILDTNLFDLEAATMAPGWLQAMKDADKKPESLEYNIGSFVYRARRPFHPQRLFDWVHSHFVLQQHMEELDDQDAMDTDGETTAEAEGIEEGVEEESEEDEDDDNAEAQAQSETMGAALDANFGNVIRSKGFAWVAGGNNDLSHWEWSQAGLVLSLKIGMPWFCVLKKAQWGGQEDGPSDELVASIQADFLDNVVGDRRQELVFIGQNMKQDCICAALDNCLIDASDWQVYRQERLEPLAHSISQGDASNAITTNQTWDHHPFDLVAPSLQEIQSADDTDEEGHGH